MRKLLLLSVVCAVGVVAFGPVAWAQQDPCPDPDYPRYTPDGCQASDLPDVSSGSATASSTPTATASATATASSTATAAASAAGGSLPGTGGPAGLASPFAGMVPLMVLFGTGIAALAVVRRAS